MMHVRYIAGRGHRSPQNILLRSERDHLLRAAAKFYPGCSEREIARQLRIALLTYRNGRWRRDRTEATCPEQHRGKPVQMLWCVLKVRDAVPSEMTIRRALFS
jgi:hypothetical protein